MTEDTPNRERRRIAATLVLDRGQGVADGPAPSPAELDLWRRGLLPPARAREVLGHIGRDPALMRQLRQLEEADRVLAHGLAAREPQAPKPAFRRLTAWLHRLTDPVWAGGWVAAAAVLLLAVLIPALHAPELDRQLDLLYGESAEADAPISLAQWPWRPAGQTKGLDFWPDPAKSQASPEKWAFRAGARQGLTRLGAGGDAWRAVLAVLPSQPPGCPEGDSACPDRLKLARQTGYWAVAVHRDCRKPAGASGPAASVDDAIRRRWEGMGQAGELAARIKALDAAADRCQTATALLDWGLR